MSTVLYAEHLRPGAVFTLGSAKISKEEILDFGRRFDPLPLHTDEDAAAASRFGGLIASGFHTTAVLQRLMVDAVFSRAAIIAGREISSLRMRAPVRPEDVLHGTMEIVEVRPATTVPLSSAAGAPSRTTPAPSSWKYTERHSGRTGRRGHRRHGLMSRYTQVSGTGRLPLRAPRRPAAAKWAARVTANCAPWERARTRHDIGSDPARALRGRPSPNEQ